MDSKTSLEETIPDQTPAGQSPSAIRRRKKKSKTLIEEKDKEEVEERKLTEDEVLFIRTIYNSYVPPLKPGQSAKDPKYQSVPTELLGKMLRSLGLSPLELDVMRMAQEVDPEDKCYIEFAPFLELIRRRIDEVVTDSDIIEAFRLFDHKNTGKVKTEEIVDVLSRLGEKFAEPESAVLLKCLKGLEDEAGQVDYREFVKKYTTTVEEIKAKVLKQQEAARKAAIAAKKAKR